MVEEVAKNPWRKVVVVKVIVELKKRRRRRERESWRLRAKVMVVFLIYFLLSGYMSFYERMIIFVCVL
jgi:hypothetical protein